MVDEMLYVIEMLMEFLLTYVGINLIKKYVFLEHELEKGKQKRYHLLSAVFVVVTYLFLKDDAVYVLLFMVAMNIVLARKEKRIRGFFLILPMSGFINGIMVPILSTPVVVCRMSKQEEILYSILVYVVIFLFLALFHFRAKKWREQFDNDMKIRRLEDWERIMLICVGVMMMFYSSTYSSLPTTTLADNVIIRGLIIDKVITALVVFGLTIIVMVLILQGNRKAYYYKKAINLSKQMVNALAKTIDAKDKYTNGHSTRVAEYSMLIAKRMGYEGEKLEQLEFSALLHDIGKIGVPREIINKPSRLTDEEYEIIKTHPGTGANILKEVTELPDIIIGARWHHERYDGKGYPDQLAGTDIPELARIIGVADAYDAMTSKRSYRDVLAQEIVKEEIEKGKGKQFDPQIADVMLLLMAEDTNYKMHE